MKINVFKQTNDEWYGNYKIEDDCRVYGLVEVKFTQTGPDPKYGLGEWRVCVWGNDDFGMERDFIDEDEALNIFYQVIGWDYVNVDPLKTLGFITA